MRKINAPLLILFVFIIAISYIIIYEFNVVKPNTYDSIYFDISRIFSYLFYSIIASSVFYLISIYIPTYLPEKHKEIKILYMISHKTRVIDIIINELELYLNTNELEFYNDFNNVLKKINPNNPVGSFVNWFKYLEYNRIRLLDLINSINIYQNHLSDEFLNEISLIEYQLLTSHIFYGTKTISCDDLTYAEISLQNILIHNNKLKKINNTELQKQKNHFDKLEEKYKKKNY